MLEANTLIKVRNRDNGRVGYTIPDLGNLHRNYMSGETKEVTMDELRKLSYVPGGMALLKDYFIIENSEAVAELLGQVEPEYNYTEAEVTELLAHGSLDQLKDCLDYAPKGVIELVKDIAVKTELNDIAKREAIFKKTMFNVTSAIENNRQSREDEGEETPVQSQRRAAPVTVKKDSEETTGSVGRRVVLMPKSE